MVVRRKKKSDSQALVPKGVLIHLKTNQIRPSPDNPRRLFDPEPLAELRRSIKAHGVLVPITVYKLPGQDKYGIVDGERRYRCCTDLKKEGLDVDIPANVVEAPDKTAGLIYMFNIHTFRESWELMPTALSLEKIMKDLQVADNEELHEITGLSFPQIDRCRTILNYSKRFQDLSLKRDPKERIPSNFWVELHPVLRMAEKKLPGLVKELSKDGLIDRLVKKYQAGHIKSVIHFRRVMEAFDVSEEKDHQDAVTDRLREFILTENLETRKAFDGFIGDTRKTRKAVGACEKFIKDIESSKVDYSIENKDELVKSLETVITFAQDLLERVRGDEPPETTEDSDPSR